MSTRRGGKGGKVVSQITPNQEALPNRQPRFLYTLMPELTAIHPAVGPVDGGTVLRLEGRRLGTLPAEVLGITVGGIPCRTLTYDSSRLIGCTTPPLYAAVVSPTHGGLAVVATIAAPHPAPFSTTTSSPSPSSSPPPPPPTSSPPSSPSADPQAGSPPPPPPPLLLPPLLLPSSELRLGLKSPPRISSVSPLSGPRAGGTRLTISGSHLGTHAADVLNVTLGTVACEEMRFVSPHQLQCSAPPAAAVGTTPV